MTPSTLVRALRPGNRGPFTFIGMAAAALERDEPARKPKAKPLPRCVAHEDDGRVCGLPARYVDFKRGGHVCADHKPERRQEALTLV